MGEIRDMNDEDWKDWEETCWDAMQAHDDAVKDYFTRLGYKLSWDFKGSDEWNEILTSDGTLIMQVDRYVPLDDLLQDLKCIKDGKPPSSSHDYIINAAEGDPNFEELLSKI